MAVAVRANAARGNGGAQMRAGGGRCEAAALTFSREREPCCGKVLPLICMLLSRPAAVETSCSAPDRSDLGQP